MNAARFPKGPRSFDWPGLIRDRLCDPVGLIQRLHREHGPVVGIRLGNLSQILVNDPALIRYILLENPAAFTKGFGYEMLRELLGNGLINSEGESWKQQRKLVQPAMTQDRFKDYAASLAEVVDAEMGRLETAVKSDPVVDVYRSFCDLSLKIICKTVLGLEFEQQIRQIQETVAELMSFIEREQLGTMARLKQVLRLRLSSEPWRIPGPLAEAITCLDRTVYTIIEQRRKEQSSSAGSVFDLAGHLVRTPMTDQQIRDEVITMFTAGYETTATALSWSARLLAENKSSQESLRAEAAELRKSSSSPMTLEQLRRLREAENVFQEAIRLFPQVWRITRFAKETLEFDGHLIPQGTLVVISQYSLQRDRRFWGPDSEVFRPGRFAQGCPANDRHSYVPFGAGPRMCIGSQFATLEAQLVLSRFAERFACAPAEPRPGFEPAVTLRPRGGMKLRLEPTRS